jgi:hypothetical protein
MMYRAVPALSRPKERIVERLEASRAAAPISSDLRQHNCRSQVEIERGEVRVIGSSIVAPYDIQNWREGFDDNESASLSICRRVEVGRSKTVTICVRKDVG